MSTPSFKDHSPGLRPSFDYQRFLAWRERLTNTIFIFCAVWWAILIVIAIGSDWWAPMARFKETILWGTLTVERLLVIGIWASVVVTIGGSWLIRNLRRPPQLFLVLRDFQSGAAAKLVSSYVRHHGGTWGYWLTLENADLRAAESLGGDVETEPEDENDRNEKFPVGSWWFTSFALGLFLMTMLVLSHLDSAPLRWMRQAADYFGFIGDLVFGVVTIVGICAIWFVISLIIRWVLLKVQRTAFVPKQINSKETFHKVLATTFSRVRRRATTLTLGPLPVISVNNAWWKDVVLRCMDQARLVVFIVTARESPSLNWEIEQVRQQFDPHRTLYIELHRDDLRLTDGTGSPISGTSFGSKEDRIETAVRRMLISNG